LILTIFDIILLIALALIFARVFGYLFDKLKQPAVIGEIIAGIILGGIGIAFFSGHVFNIFNFEFIVSNLNYNSIEFGVFAEFGILFLLFISGLQTSIPKLKKIGKASAYVALGGIFIPLVLGFLSGIFLGFSNEESILIGLILIATSVGITVRSLMDLHVLDTNVGATVISAAVIDDIIGVIFFAFFLGIDSPIYIGIKIVLFFLIFLYIGLKVIDKFLNLGEKIHLPKSFLSIVLAIFLIFTFFADRAGIAGIIGAFIAGLLIGNTIKTSKIIDNVQAIGYGLFIPLFFVWIGASLWEHIFADISIFSSIIILALIIILIGILGKIIGCGLGAKLGGMSNKESLQVGIGMIPRMELALVIASSAITHNFIQEGIGHQILVATIILTIITSILTPSLIKASFKKG
jgi:Kef-type K+ transport system membrane component KefB